MDVVGEVQMEMKHHKATLSTLLPHPCGIIGENLCIEKSLLIENKVKYINNGKL